MSDRYEIREEIGKGGLGAVYKAFDNQLHREVAMKRVLTTDQGSADEVEAAANNLTAEAQTLSSLNHPNIVTVFDIGRDDKGGFVVMELLKGETLDETVERGVLTQDDFIEVVHQTMEALIAAQAADVLHRDLKPTNVMVIWQPSGKFQTKILDFGLAKFSKTPSVQTMDQEDAVMGSIFFMAPEQFERAELDQRSDLYQMGCVYYHALTGQYPFRGETGPQVMNAHLQHRVTPLDKLRPDMSPSICQWVMWLINRDMENRPAGAQAALDQFPKNPEPPGEIVLQAIPVEETVDESTATGVHVVVPEHDAKPPPKLIITGSSPVSGGSGPVRRHGGSGPVRRHGATAAVNPEQRKKTKIIAGSIAGVVVLAGIGLFFLSNAKTNAARKTLSNLASQEAPQGGLAEVELGLKFLNGKKATSQEKKEAVAMLSNLQGKGIDAAILNALQESDSSYTQWKLSQVLGDRGFGEAVPAMISAFGRSNSPTIRTDILTAVRQIAGPEDAGALIDALSADLKISHRAVLESILLEICRKQPPGGKVTGPILARVSNAGANEGPSLYRILGSLGGEEVLIRLRSVYNQDQDQGRRIDAMAAYLSWPDRSALAQLAELIEKEETGAIRNWAVEAYSRIASLPAAVPMDEKIAGWRQALEWGKSADAFKNVFVGVINNPAPETLALAKEFEGGSIPNLSSRARLAGTVIGNLLKDTPVLAETGRLEPFNALIQGNPLGAVKLAATDAEGKPVDPPSAILTNWHSPAAWFVWHFKVKTEGKFGIEVIQSDLNDTPSEFQVIIGGQALAGKSKQTKSWQDFEAVLLDGTVTLEAEKVHTLILKADGVTQPRMMDIQSLRLIAQ